MPPVPSPDEDGAPSVRDDANGPSEAGEDAREPHSERDGGHEQRRERDASEEDDRGYDDLRRVHQLVNNNFYGVVDATGAAFGFGATGAHRLAPGTITPEQMDRALRFYVPPQPCFDMAYVALLDEALVVLTGQDNSGRGAGALALLRKILGRDARLLSLSPADALATLAASKDLKPGQGYVILDYVGETQLDAVQAYEIARLREELLRKGSFLVITAGPLADRRLALRDHCVPWQTPDPLELFDHCRRELPGVDIETEVEKELRERIAEQRRPKDVVDAAEVLAREGLEAARDSLRYGHRERVQRLFRPAPAAADLLPLAALAFLEGTPERTFEKEYAALTSHVRDWEQSGETSVAESDGSPGGTLGGTVAQQSRFRWRERAVGLVTTGYRIASSGDTGRRERCLLFTAPGVRELVIEELHNLYGYELWYPLRLWLSDLARRGDLDTRTEVARGVAILARYALVEVDEQLLKVWSDGLTSERVTAALVLQFMCDEDLASQALHIVLGWVDRSGPGRAVTAAMALTGPLGALYRLEALNQLWFLMLRGERIAFSARRALVLLLQTAEQDPERVLFILRYLRTVIAKSAPGSRERSVVLGTVVQLLEADGLQTSEPVTVVLLRSVPDSVRHLGSLWADVLNSSNRSRAVRALCRTLDELKDDPAVTGAVRELGEAMRNAMNRRQWAALCHHLSIALRHPDYAIPGTRQLAQVLLGSLRGRVPADSRSRGGSLVSITAFPSTRGGRSK